MSKKLGIDFRISIFLEEANVYMVYVFAKDDEESLLGDYSKKMIDIYDPEEYNNDFCEVRKTEDLKWETFVERMKQKHDIDLDEVKGLSQLINGEYNV